MALVNTTSQYGAVTKTLHWLTALMILTVIPLGLIANGLAEDIRNPDIATSENTIARAALLFSLHKTIGICIFFVSVARISWALAQTRPGLLNAEERFESFAAATVHWLLYGSLLLVPLSGWIHHASTTGFAPILWPLGQDLPLIQKNETVAETFASLHLILERVLIVSLLLHVAGALKHHFVDRDMTLLRMWPGQRPVPAPPTQHHSVFPLFAALCVWAGALGLGAAIGASQKDEHVSEVAELEAVQSDWQVIEGDLSITVSQLGSPVIGGFADWTAAIVFDATTQSGPAGQVDVTVSIPSLSLGSVTSQAMGPDFFDAEKFPQANFSAQIEKTEDGYVASGMLTIRDVSVPISLPFDLQIKDNQATMTGEVALNRLDYDIGASMPDESSLGFAVELNVALKAKRAE